MKRSKFFCPLAGALSVFALWLVLCLLLVGVPALWDRYPSGCWSPTDWILGPVVTEGLVRHFETVVDFVWRLAPWSAPRRPPLPPLLRDLPEEEMQAEPRLLVEVERNYRGGPEWSVYRRYLVYVDWGGDVFGRTTLYATLYAPEFGVYVFLLPGAHFGLVAFVLVGAVTLLTRVLIRPTPEGVAPPPGGKQEGAQP